MKEAVNNMRCIADVIIPKLPRSGLELSEDDELNQIRHRSSAAIRAPIVRQIARAPEAARGGMVSLYRIALHIGRTCLEMAWPI